MFHQRSRVALTCCVMPKSGLEFMLLRQRGRNLAQTGALTALNSAAFFQQLEPESTHDSPSKTPIFVAIDYFVFFSYTPHICVSVF